jgi:hypothetical protein
MKLNGSPGEMGNVLIGYFNGVGYGIAEGVQTGSHDNSRLRLPDTILPQPFFRLS